LEPERGKKKENHFLGGETRIQRCGRMGVRLPGTERGKKPVRETLARRENGGDRGGGNV